MATDTPAAGSDPDKPEVPPGAAAPPPFTEPEPELDLEMTTKRSKARAVVEMLMPLVEAYAGRRVIPDAETGAETKTGLFTTGEEAVLAMAGRKAFAETVQYTSKLYPVMGAEPFEAVAKDGATTMPDTFQILSLARAAGAFAKRDQNEHEEQGIPEQQVMLLAVKPGEYPYSDVPVTPAEARRAAYMQRIETPPPPAMLATQSGNGYAIMPAQAAGQGSSGQAAMMASGNAYYGMTTRYSGNALQAGGGGCGCSSCAGGHAGFTFPDARYDEAGKCKSLFSISCETQWRLRECFKTALCDTLRCIGSELCEDGQLKPHPDLKQCLEQFLCTMVACLPEAICPTGAPQAGCLPGSATDCGCNFAVGK